ncbi:MAG TPA: hypothetical protein VIS09_05735 [Streptomyces sp.]
MSELSRRTVLQGSAAVGLVTAGATGLTAVPARAAQPAEPADPYRDSVQDARMIWDRPPDAWDDAPCLGDGALRIQVLAGGTPDRLVFAVRGKDSSWRSPATGPVLRLVGTPTAHHWQLDLWQAELRGTITTTRGSVRFTAFVPHGRGVLVVRLETGGAESGAAWERVAGSGAAPELPHREETGGPVRVLVAGADAAAVRRALADPDGLKSGHRRWWHDHYRRGFLSVPDRTVQRFHWTQVYLTAAALSPDTRVTGFGHPFAGATDHLALDPVLAADRPRAADHSHLYGGLPGVGSKGGRALDPITSWGLPALAAAWSRSMDEDLLRDRLHPALRKAVRFYTHFLVAEPDGRLHLPATHSPHYADAPDAAHGLALLRWALGALADSTRRLGARDDGTDRPQDVAARLAPYPSGPDGVMVGRGVALTRSHAYASHLLWIHPLRERLPDARAPLAHRSYSHWASMREHWNGSSYVTASGLAAATGDADGALAHIRQFLSGLGGGGLYRGADGEPDGGTALSVPLAGAQSVLDLLLETSGGTLRVFPSVPGEWQDAVVAGLRTPGAFLVDAERGRGRTEWVRVRSEAGEPLVLDHGIEGPVEVLDGSGRPRPWRPGGPRTVRASLARGESLVVARAGTRPTGPRVVEAAGTSRAWGLAGRTK